MSMHVFPTAPSPTVTHLINLAVLIFLNPNPSCCYSSYALFLSSYTYITKFIIRKEAD